MRNGFKSAVLGNAGAAPMKERSLALNPPAMGMSRGTPAPAVTRKLGM